MRRYFHCGYFHTTHVGKWHFTCWQANGICKEWSRPAGYARRRNMTPGHRGVVRLWLWQWFVALLYVIWPCWSSKEHEMPRFPQRERQHVALSEKHCAVSHTSLQPCSKKTIRMCLCCWICLTSDVIIIKFRWSTLCSPPVHPNGKVKLWWQQQYPVMSG